MKTSDLYIRAITILVTLAIAFPSYAESDSKLNTKEAEIVDISNLLESRTIFIKWNGLSVGIYKRTKNDIETLRTSNKLVYDPYSKKQTLPDSWVASSLFGTSVDLTSTWINTPIRSQNVNYFVFYRVSPDSGCEVYPATATEPKEFKLPEDWLGGFYDACSKVKYDYSGRVYAGVSTGKHLFIPTYRFIDEGHIELY